MSHDLIFWLVLSLMLAVTAIFVVACSLITERSGPLIGALIVTLPASAGPAYVLLAMDHDAAFVAASAIGGLVMLAVNAVFCLVYAAAAQQHGVATSFGAAFAIWLILAAGAESQTWTLARAGIFAMVMFAACVPFAERFRDVDMPAPSRRWYDVPLRALLVCTFVAAVGGLSTTLGPTLSGGLAMFPVALSCMGLIFHPRLGGPAAAAIMANAISASAGFAIALVLLHATATSLGVAPALCLALSVSVGWNVTIWGLRRHGSVVWSWMTLLEKAAAAARGARARSST